MKRIIIKSLILSIIMIFAISLKSFAQSSIRFYCKEGLKINPGETIEVPIYIDNIKIQGIEKKIFSFSGTIDYDTSVFELVPYNEDGNTSMLKINDAILYYGIIVKYNNSTRVISTALDYGNNPSYFNEMLNSQQRQDDAYLDRYLNKTIQVGSIKVKAKDSATSGDYKCKITNVHADNSEGDFASIELDTKIHVNESNSDVPESYQGSGEHQVQRSYNRTQGTTKAAIVTIQVSTDGKKITVIPDEENGETIKEIKYKNTTLTKQDGKFILVTEPNMVYELFIYGENGACLGNEYVITRANVEEDNQGENGNNSGNNNEQGQNGNNNSGNNNEQGQNGNNNSENNNEQGQNDNNSDNKNDEEKNNDDNSNNKEENGKKNSDSKGNNVSEKGSNSENKNNNSENVKKSPQTGDYIVFAIAILITAIVGVLWTIIPGKKQKNA